MHAYPSDIAFTESVKAVQTQKGSRSQYARMEQRSGWQTKVTAELKTFLSELDMFYLGTASQSGQPYIQYRGGSPGFLKVLDQSTLGFADFAGNQQFITLGNLAENPQAFLFLIDYVQRRRVKIWGTARSVEDDPELLAQLHDPAYPGRVERAILFTVTAWDINCPQHIHPRLPQADVLKLVEQLQTENQQLKAEQARLHMKMESGL
ncbi:pyridoxamine 5'-phosphate oxidase family protein [Gimesia sp.]|uniref:pyridoxamine 5'-phosphate oxidase family protein n=1 Tax=Gimesia sp. TaxID=2024833 RepID=UPI000C40CFA5|nr:pyridoxamine 5'-phosphate oxidase family protein [Gimesia sp.]MAX40677.1 pyridoxamine 5'-phosphate oxidase [Gimesia sp.]HBL45477.1 pyridoxamine 5'-phosphate oxidase [Planctomycetaceae bacterium]|tara:strand:- start:5408 stop:6028 length:621 start_codon:yes stop_codon:yes gene_type:complete